MKNLRFIIVLFLLSSCQDTVPRYSVYGQYDRHYGSCPCDPKVEHYRILSKRMNPEYCNFIYELLC